MGNPPTALAQSEAGSGTGRSKTGSAGKPIHPKKAGRPLVTLTGRPTDKFTPEVKRGSRSPTRQPGRRQDRSPRKGNLSGCSRRDQSTQDRSRRHPRGRGGRGESSYERYHRQGPQRCPSPKLFERFHDHSPPRNLSQARLNHDFHSPDDSKRKKRQKRSTGSKSRPRTQSRSPTRHTPRRSRSPAREKDKFKMETQPAIHKALSKGEWVNFIDIKDAYFHVPIKAQAKNFLCFPVRETVYQFRALPFGLTTAPKEFTSVTATLASIVHRKGINLHLYLDDWLLRANSFQKGLVHIKEVVAEMTQLSFIVNPDATVLLSGRGFRPSPGHSSSDSGECRQDPYSLAHSPEASMSGSLFPVEGAGSPQRGSRRHPSGQTLHETTSTLPTQPVVHVHTTFVLQGDSEQLLPGTPTLVEQSTEFAARTTSSNTEGDRGTVYQQFSQRVGGQPSMQSIWPEVSGIRTPPRSTASTGWSSRRCTSAWCTFSTFSRTSQ